MNDASKIRQGVILFGHGARDARWAEPFERLRARVEAGIASRAEDARVRLAYLEMMEPDLDGAASALIDDGCTRVTIVPIFFGVGSHLRRDLPQRVDALRARFPRIDIAVADAAGEDSTVVDALADYCLRSMPGPEA